MVMGILDAIQNVGESVVDVGQEFYQRRKQQLEELAMYQHSKAMILCASAISIIYITGLTSADMIEGELQCISGTTHCDLMTPRVWDDSQRQIKIGLWRATVMDAEHAICQDWPAADDPICSSIKAARAFIFLAIILSVASVVAALVRIKESDTAPKSVLFLLSSGISGMIGYSIWQANCQKQLADMVWHELVRTQDPAWQYTENTRFWRTVGFSYSCILWAWIFSLVFLGAKVTLPGLSNIDKKIRRHTSRGLGGIGI